MKIFPLLALLILPSVIAQTPGNSQERQPVDKAQRRAFNQWDQEEEEARNRAERLRLLNEERAREVQPRLPRQEQQAEECKCPPTQTPSKK